MRRIQNGRFKQTATSDYRPISLKEARAREEEDARLVREYREMKRKKREAREAMEAMQNIKSES